MNEKTHSNKCAMKTTCMEGKFIYLNFKSFQLRLMRLEEDFLHSL
jgi:hypothetical protein